MYCGDAEKLRALLGTYQSDDGGAADPEFLGDCPLTQRLNLVVAAIVLWNTVYLERAVAAIRQTGQTVFDEALAHLSPLKWEHINLTGDYHWRKDAGLRNRKSRPLRTGKPGLIP